MAGLLGNRLYFCRCVITINLIKSVIPSKSGFVKRFLFGKFSVMRDFIKSHFIDDSNEYLTIILRNRAEYRLILSRRGRKSAKIRRYSARLSRIIGLLFNKLITKLVTFLNLSVDIFSLHFFFPRTKLHIPPDICYLRMTDIESIMTIFG